MEDDWIEAGIFVPAADGRILINGTNGKKNGSSQKHPATSGCSLYPLLPLNLESGQGGES